jgi:hypothetical protein
MVDNNFVVHNANNKSIYVNWVKTFSLKKENIIEIFPVARVVKWSMDVIIKVTHLNLNQELFYFRKPSLPSAISLI